MTIHFIAIKAFVSSITFTGEYFHVSWCLKPEGVADGKLDCRGSTAFRRWWATAGGGGPQYADNMLIDHRPADDPNRRHELLDRFAQHTRHCSSCSKVQHHFEASENVGTYCGAGSPCCCVKPSDFFVSARWCSSCPKVHLL